MPRVVLLLLAVVAAGPSAGHRHQATIVSSGAATASGSPDPSGHNQDHNATLHTLSGYKLAMCLDGSPGAYYLKPGAEHAKFLIFRKHPRNHPVHSGRVSRLILCWLGAGFRGPR